MTLDKALEILKGKRANAYEDFINRHTKGNGELRAYDLTISLLNEVKVSVIEK